MKYYFKLIRWPNLLIIALTMYVIRFGIIEPVLDFNSLQLQLSEIVFLILVMSTMMIAAGGYAINDYFDRLIDQENKPDEVIVETHICRRKVMTVHNLTTFIGILLGAYVSWFIGHIMFAIIFIMISGLLWF